MSRADDPLLIDENALDQECYDQPRRARHAGEVLADARYTAARAKAKLKLVEAELFLMYKNGSTVEAAKASVVKHVDYQEAQEVYLQAEKVVGDKEAEYWAFRDRKSMLETAVQLHLTHYHSEPKFSKNAVLAQEARDKKKEKLRESAEVPMKRKKKLISKERD